MFYRLKEPYVFTGYKFLPFAIEAMDGEHYFDKPYFFKKNTFLRLLDCNGQNDMEADKVIRELVKIGVIEESETRLEPLRDYQKYHVFKNKYMKSIHWSITGRCNFKCRHCLMSASNGRHDELSLDKCFNIIDQISECGIKRVDITGGEPLVRRDFEELVRYLSEKNIKINLIFTNASLLNGEVLDMLERYRQKPAFQLSFDGLGHHDWLRGVKGAEREADEAFKLLKERNYTVLAAMCIHKGNKDSLRDTINYLSDNGVKALKVNAPQELGVWKQYSDEFALSHDEQVDIYTEYIPHYFEDGMPMDVEFEGYFKCSKGSYDYKIGYVHKDKNYNLDTLPYCESLQYNAYISPEGRLVPCMGFADTVLQDKFPSIFDKPLWQQLNDSYYREVAKATVGDLVRSCKKCRDCEYLRRCYGGCMLAGMDESGNYLLPDENICRFFHSDYESRIREAADNALKKYRKQEA